MKPDRGLIDRLRHGAAERAGPAALVRQLEKRLRDPLKARRQRLRRRPPGRTIPEALAVKVFLKGVYAVSELVPEPSEEFFSASASHSRRVSSALFMAFETTS